MQSNPSPARLLACKRSLLIFRMLAIAVGMLATYAVLPGGLQSSASNLAGRSGPGRQSFSPAAAANETCATATVINPAALPFLEDSTTVDAVNDIDPGVGGCLLGLGPDVVYSFTPAVTDTYVIGATPIGCCYDLAFYIVTDCANPAATCVASANARGSSRTEVLTTTLNAGTQYFIVIDSTQQNDAGAFHFSLRRGTPANDTCATATVIEPSRLPFITSATTFGAANDLNPGTPCLRTSLSANGPDVVFQFTPADTQQYVLDLTPVANFDATIYVVTGCPSLTGCSSSDVNGSGSTETLRRTLTAGTTYFIVVDGAGGDSGDFTLSLVPSSPLAPPAPTNLIATAISSTQVDLAWQDNSSNELGFRIERSLNGSDFTELATVGSNVTSFSDTTVFPSTTFFYRVLAFNNFGNSASSNIAAATTPAPPVPPTPVIAVQPAQVDFGTVQATRDATRTITITNNGGAPLVISAISDPAPPFSIVNKPALPITIAPGESIILTVRFAPLTAGSVSGSFTIQSNDPGAPLVTVPLSGIGSSSPVPNLSITPPTVDFSGGSGSTVVELRNTGDADLLISSIIPPRAPFSISASRPLPAILKPGESILLTVSFSPAAPGFFTGNFIVLSNDPDQVLTPISIRGTSTPQNELLKLRAPTLVTAVQGAATTLNVIAVNGTNTNISLSASPVPGGTFTDRGNGRGDLVLTPAADATGSRLVTFSATDSTGSQKTLQSVITVLPLALTHRVQVTWTAPETAPNPPTNVLANDLSITLLTASEAGSQQFEPAVAAGLVGYVIYRSQVAGAPISLTNIVGVVPAAQTSFTDTVPSPPSSPQVFFYKVTALYQTGTESAASNETSNAPRMIGLEFKKKRIRFQAANSNVAVGAVLVVDGREVFALKRDGNLIIVDKNTRSSPGNLRVRDIFRSGSSHTVEVRNPNGAGSTVVTLTR